MMKGQVQQAFIFIIFILVAGVVALMGYKAVTEFTGQSCDAQKITFQKEITGFFDQYDDYDSLHKERLKLPCDYTAICFVNHPVDEVDIWNVEGANQELIQSAAEAEDRNIFLVGEFTEPIAYSEKVMVQDGDEEAATCHTATGGYVDLTFKGRGQGTLVEG